MDIDEELLGLAEGTSGHKRKSTAPKRKHAPEPEDSASDMDMSSDSDIEPSSHNAPRNVRPRQRDSDDDNDDDNAPVEREDNQHDDPYESREMADPRDLFPLEGKYIDRDDRARQASIENMTEFQREAILEERQQRIDAHAERLQLRQMVQRKEDKAQRGANASSDDDEGDEQYGSRSTRDRKTTGTTKEKRDGLAKLRRSREEKGKKKEQKQRQRGEHGGDDDDDDYEGETSARRRAASSDDYSDDVSDYDMAPRSASKHGFNRPARKGEEPAGPSELSKIIVTRTKLAEFCSAPWFEEWVRGAWVRLGVGPGPDHVPQYRICQVTGVREGGRPYALESTKTNVELELKHGSSIRFFSMDVVSNSPMVPKEYGRLQSQLSADRMLFPSQKDVDKIKKQLEKRKEFIMTEADVSAVLAKKGARVNPAAGKARLLIQRDFARQTGDEALLAEVSAQLAKFDTPPPSPGRSGLDQESEQDRMKRLNERNRATNREEIKRAEGRAQDERRRQAVALARGDSSVKVDPSARVKTMTRLKYDRDTPSRPLTPAATDIPAPSVVATSLDEQQSDKKATSKGSKFEELAASRVQIDLDLDF